MAQLHANYVRQWVSFKGLTARDEAIAKKFLGTKAKREVVLRAVMLNGSDFLDCEGAKSARYMAERQSQGMFDFWHFSAVYHAVGNDWESSPLDLMQIFTTVEANRPHYLVENWRSVLIEAARAS